MTTRKDRRVTIVVHTDGDLASRQYRVPVWAFEAGKWGALVVGLLVVLFFAFAGPIGRAAARVPGLERQVARLEVENSRVQQLAAALNRAEANYQELRTMLGVRAPREKGSAPTEDLVRAVAVRARPPSAPLRYEPGPAEPTHWPLDLAGFVTRGHVRPGGLGGRTVHHRNRDARGGRHHGRRRREDRRHGGGYRPGGPAGARGEGRRGGRRRDFARGDHRWGSTRQHPRRRAHRDSVHQRRAR